MVPVLQALMNINEESSIVVNGAVPLLQARNPKISENLPLRSYIDAGNLYRDTVSSTGRVNMLRNPSLFLYPT